MTVICFWHLSHYFALTAHMGNKGMGMFNTKRIEKLEERVRKLEAAQYIRSRLQVKQEWIVYGEYSTPSMEARKIPLTEAIQVIADHLGLQFVYEESMPERLTLQKPAKGK